MSPVWRKIKLIGQHRIRYPWGVQCRFRRGELRERRFHPFDIGFGHLFQIDQGISRNFVDPDQLIEFQLHRLRIAALGVLKAKTGTIIGKFSHPGASGGQFVLDAQAQCSSR